MKKLFLLAGVILLLAFPAISFGADAEITLHVNGTDLIPDPDETTPYTPAEYDEEGTETQAEQKGVVTFPAVSGTNYTFSTVEKSLEFAKNPQVYIQNNYTGTIRRESYDVEYDPSLQSTMSTVTVSIETGSISYAVDLSSYAAVTNITFIANPRTLTVSAGERHFITAGQNVTFSGITFSGSSAGGGVTVEGGTATFTDCAFSNCYISGNGGGVSVSEAGVTFTGTTFTGCEASGNGGGLYVSGAGNATLSGASFTSCTASSGNGGGFNFSGTGTLTLTSPSFTTCTASGSGGGLYISGSGTVTLSGSSFISCTASNNGGGFSSSGGVLTVSGTTTFNNNTANAGGAISLTGGSLTLADTSFTGNTATNGGAIYTSSSLTIGSGVTFNSLQAASPNTATNGGAIYVASGTTTISGAEAGFTENSAEYGGAIYAASGTVNVSGSGIAFTENRVANDGGAIYAGAGARVNLTGESLSVTGNVATDGSGGAIFASGDRIAITITSATSEFTSNVAESGKGGAIAAGGGASLTISGAASFTTNTADYGGAVYLGATRRGQTALNITGDSEAKFTRNSANTSGGGIYAEAYSTIAFSPTVTFTGNRAEDGNGGAMWVALSSQLPEGTVYFDSNTATKSDSTSTTTGSGGAIYVGETTSSALTLGSTRAYTFTGNEAASYGGGLCTYESDIIFDGYTVTEENKAVLGGGFAASYNSTITLNNSSISSQTTEGSGGAVWAANIVAISSDFGSNGANTSTGSGNHQGGGALYSLGELTLTTSTFTNNTAIQGGGAAYSYAGEMTVTDSTFTQNGATQGGGALYAEASQVSITNSYFATNSTSSGNGGAVALQGYCKSVITTSTFRSNTSSRLDGGAIYAQGTVEITQCYLRENKSQRSGGAIYFNQNSDNASNYSKFTMTSTMLDQNTTSGVEGNGGGLYVVANDATVNSCTFTGNRLVLAGNAGEGGGAYIAAQPIQNEDVEIINCTFYDNHINDGLDGSSGGGGLAIHCEKTTIVKSCTFTLNGSQYKGGAIYLGDGSKLSISGTILVGNTDDGTYDLWSDGNISSGGYNRIGVYGTGTGVTDFYSETRNDSDRTAYPAKGWSKATFFSNNILDVNERTDLGSNVPPYLGSTLSSRTRLLTLMLNEEESLALVDRATNIIPYTRRGVFPTTDARGVARVPAGTTINLDIGACFFDGTRTTPGGEEPEIYTISRLEISGVPNNLRRVGQTASLIAKVYYTNGRTALGGTGTGEEPVEWTSDKPNIVQINKDTGDIVVLNFTPGNTYVTITAATIRGDASGKRVSDSQPIKVTEYSYSYLNTSPAVMKLQSYAEQLTEYDISLQLAEGSSSAINSSTFQSSFSNIWGNVTASQVQVADIADDAITFNTVKNYSASDGYNLTSGKAGVNVNLTGLKEGDLFPLTYSWTFSGSELQSILGYDMTGKTITASVADEIFSAMRVDFKGESSSWPVIGSGGVKASDAMSAGALKLSSADSGKGLSAELTAYLANVTASGANMASATNDGPQIVDGLLVVPDGNGSDGKIYGAVVMTGKSSSSQNTNTNTGTNTGTKGSSGGGGCESFGAVISSLAVIFMAGLKRRKQ